jgi:drug/metabolite transporter (DMT)-like permease
MRRAFLIALATALLWALYLVVTRFVVSRAGLDPWAYTLVQLLAGGVFISWLGRKAPGNWRALFTPWMVGYGILRVGVTGASSAALAWLVVTQSTLLSTANVLMGALAALLVHHIVPPRLERIALAILAAGIVVLVACLQPDTAYRGALWLLASETGVVVAALAVEKHPRNRSDDIADRSRFTAETLIITSIVLIVAWSLAGALGLAHSPWDLDGNAFGHPLLWLWGIGTGLVFRGPGQWLTFYTLRHAGTQAYLIALMLMPAFAVAIEIGAARLGLVDAPGLSTGEWIGAGLILGAAMLLMVLRLRHQ